MWISLTKLNVHIFNNNLTCFSNNECTFSFYDLNSSTCVSNLIIVCWNNLRWGRLAASLYSPLLMTKVGKTLDENAETFNQKFSHVGELFFFFGKSVSLFGKVSINNCKNSFLKFFISFLTKFSFVKVHLRVLGRSLVSFSWIKMSAFRLTAKLTAKMVCICQECKCTREMSSYEKTSKFPKNRWGWS